MDMQVSVDGNQDKPKGNQDGRARSLANLRPQRAGEASRNPRGRPKKDLDLAALAQKHAQHAVDTLVEVMKDKDATPSARVSAASELLDRGFGSAPKSLDINHTMTISEAFESFVRSLNDRSSGHLIEATVVEAAQ